MVGLGLVGGALRFATLGQQSFWFDEAATGRLLRAGFGRMLRGVADGESTPPLYYVLAWVWTRGLGTGEIGVRSFSALVGTLSIPIVYAAADRLLGRRAAVAAAALACFSPLLIWYSQEARSYALLVALCGVSLWALGPALDPGARRRTLVGWGVVCALALATHYFAVFVIAPQAIWLARVRGRAAAPALIGIGLLGCALLPLALHQRARGGAAFIATSPLGTRVVQTAKQLAVGYDTPGQIVLTAAGALLVLGLVGRLLRRPPELTWRLAGVAAAGVGVPVVLAAVGVDYVITRNLIGVWVPAALVLAAAGARAGGRTGPALVAGLCAVGLAATLGVDLNPRFQRDDWRGAAQTVPAGASALVVSPASGEVPLGYFLRRTRPLPAGGAPVAWVEVIGLGARGVGSPLRAPPLPAPAPALAGFDPPLARRTATFSVLRYRATGPAVVVTPAMLAPLALIRGGAAVLAARR